MTMVFLSGLHVPSSIAADLMIALAPDDDSLLLDYPELDTKLINRSIDEQLEWITTSLASKIPEQSTLIGWSLGGLLAIALAHRYPNKVSQLIIMASSPKFAQAKNWPGIEQSILTDFSDQARNKFTRLIKKFNYLIGYPSLNRSYVQTTHPPQFFDYLKILTLSDMRFYLSSLDLPMLYLFGGMDAIVPYQASKKIVKLNAKIQIKVIDDAGHLLFMTHKEHVVQSVNEFIRSKDVVTG